MIYVNSRRVIFNACENLDYNCLIFCNILFVCFWLLVNKVRASWTLYADNFSGQPRPKQAQVIKLATVIVFLCRVNWKFIGHVYLSQTQMYVHMYMYVSQRSW